MFILYMCVSACAYKCVCMCLNLHMQVYLHLCVWLHVYMCLLVCMCLCVHVYLCVWICVCLCMFMCVCMAVCVHACVYTCACVYKTGHWLGNSNVPGLIPGYACHFGAGSLSQKLFMRSYVCVHVFVFVSACGCGYARVCTCMFVSVCQSLYMWLYGFITTIGIFGPPDLTHVQSRILSVLPTSEDDLILFPLDEGMHTCMHLLFYIEVK